MYKAATGTGANAAMKHNLSLQVEEKQPELLTVLITLLFFLKNSCVVPQKITLQRGTWCSVEGIHLVTQIPNSTWSS